MSKQQCLLRCGDFRAISTLDAVRGQAFSALCGNSPTALIGFEYTEVFRRPHSQKSRGLTSGDDTGQLTGTPCRLHVWFGCCLAM